MEYVSWSPLFSVKNPHIDQQHKRLFDIVNEFHSAYKAKENKDYVFSILNKLIQYTEEHFRDEERVLKASGCSDEFYNNHVKEHEKLIEEIFQLNMDLQSGVKKSLNELERFFDKWLINHVLEEDKRYLDFIK